MGSNDGSQKGGIGRRPSFAHSLDARSLHKEARKDWMFRKAGVQEYRGRLKPYTQGSVGRASVDSDRESSEATPRSRTLNSRRGSLWGGTLDTEVIASPQKSLSGLTALFGSNVLSSWQDLAGAPLFEDSLIDPTPHFLDALLMLTNALRATDDVTGEQLRLTHITQRAVQKLSDTSCPASIRRKCKMIHEVVELFGWSDGAFRPPLILSNADRLRSAILEKMQNDDNNSSDGSLYVQDPRHEFIEGVQMTWWQEVMADVWEVLKPPPEGSTGCTAQTVVAAVQVIVLLFWSIYYCVATLPEYHCATGHTRRTINALEATFGIYYSLEAALKLLVTPTFYAQLRKPLFVMELIALVPFYVRFIWRWAGGSDCITTGIIGHINMFTVLRIFKATTYMGGHLDKLASVIRASAYTLSLGVCLLVLCVLMMSNLMYYVEMESGAGGYTFVDGGNRSYWIRNEEPAVVVNETGNVTTVHTKQLSPFQSQIDFYWWCITTITTVGYGDAAPTTGGGRVLAGLCMVIGVLVFAVPASVICSHFTLSKNEALLRTERNERSEIRDYVREICLRSNDSFAQIMLHHFVMLDVVELHHQQNPSVSDLASEIYQRILWIYRASRYAEKIMLNECEQRARINREHEGDFVPMDAFSNNASEICKKRFTDNCAEVFRSERARLWETFATIKKKEAMQGP